MRLHFSSQVRQMKKVISMSKSYRVLAFLALLFLGTFLVSCFEDDDDLEGLEIDCADLAYSDTIFYIKPGQNYIENPLKSFQGTYTVVPEGLAIDPSTGAIDVNASESGLKYKISFTPNGTEQVCETYITIGGINYLDGVYILSQNQLIASPVYNGVPGLALPCEDDNPDDDDDDSSCDFDADNPSGELLKDLGFEISSKGDFDLKKTVENGTFGATPVNGTILDVELYYQLNDPSALALNKIPLRFFYYNKLSDVPKEVLDDIEEKSKLINESGADKYFNFRTLETVRPAGQPRPPYVVIVASLE